MKCNVGKTEQIFCLPFICAKNNTRDVYVYKTVDSAA